MTPAPMSGYTLGMKTAVSIPDHIYTRAERLARRTKRSRSRLFTDALDEYLARHDVDKMTEAMDRTIDAVGTDVEREYDFTRAAAREILARTEW